MSCASCADLCVRYQIRHPRELQSAIDIASQNVEDGTIVEVQDASLSNQFSFSELASGTPWGDTVEHHFRCVNCGELFYLHAETYHGSGGYWGPENAKSIRENL